MREDTIFGNVSKELGPCAVKIGNAYQILIGTYQGERPRGRHYCRLEYNGS
jgi:hypothetical protein